jgi:hypothetical protein
LSFKDNEFLDEYLKDFKYSTKKAKKTKELFRLLLRERRYIFMDSVCGKVQSDFLDACLAHVYGPVGT